MAYVDLTGLIERFGELEIIQLTDRLNMPPSAIDGATVERAIDDASSLIDGYVGKIYALPLSDIPPALSKAAADIAWYYLHGAAAGNDDAVSRAYDAALKWLRDIATGVVKLPLAGPITSAPSGAARIHADAPVLTRDSLRVLG